jgi:hypothetical protein
MIHWYVLFWFIDMCFLKIICMCKSQPMPRRLWMVVNRLLFLLIGKPTRTQQQWQLQAALYQVKPILLRAMARRMFGATPGLSTCKSEVCCERFSHYKLLSWPDAPIWQRPHLETRMFRLSLKELGILQKARVCTTLWWTFSRELTCISKENTMTFLILGASDARHIVKTVARAWRHSLKTLHVCKNLVLFAVIIDPDNAPSSTFLNLRPLCSRASSCSSTFFGIRN